MKMMKKSVCMTLACAMTLASLPYSAQAAVIGSREALTSQTSDPRSELQAFLNREEVVRVLEEHGVDPLDAKARVAAMSPQEAANLAERIKDEPAGAGVVGTLFAVFVILLVTDILGLTKVFPFTRSVR